MRTLFLLVAASLTAGCTDVEPEPTAPNQLRGDDKADANDPLWAGLTSVTIERYASDPCNDGRTALGDNPIVYNDWVRQRAGVRNICFEVWQPGVTDWDNPDFWQQLDVQAHYRYGSTGAFQSKHVRSIDRRGNNRRYAWSIDYALDPTAYAPTLPTLEAPFTILSETPGWAYIAADLELYFTINGRVLNAPSDRPFVVRYEGNVRVPQLAAKPDGYVLGDTVTCEQGALRIGFGAGYFAADIRQPAAIAALGEGAGGSWIYGGPVALAGSSGNQVLSMTFSSSQNVTGQVLPGFGDHRGLRFVPDGSSLRLELMIYDRALGTTRQLTSTFSGCAATTN